MSPNGAWAGEIAVERREFIHITVAPTVVRLKTDCSMLPIASWRCLVEENLSPILKCDVEHRRWQAGSWRWQAGGYRHCLCRSLPREGCGVGPSRRISCATSISTWPPGCLAHLGVRAGRQVNCCTNTTQLLQHNLLTIRKAWMIQGCFKRAPPEPIPMARLSLLP